MKTIKAKCVVYDCKTHKMREVVKDIPVYEDPKPIPPVWEIKIRKLTEELDSLKNSIPVKTTTLTGNVSKSGKIANNDVFSKETIGSVPAGIGKVSISGKIVAAAGGEPGGFGVIYKTVVEIIIGGSTVATLSTWNYNGINIKKDITILSPGGSVVVKAYTSGSRELQVPPKSTPPSINLDINAKILEVV